MDEKLFIDLLAEHQIMMSEDQLQQFSLYYETLVEWNNKINLTTITNKDEVFLKHFFDSISASFYYNFHPVQTVCDIGAGAGFPSLPLKICFPHLKITIVDSLQKRIHFLTALVEKLNLNDVELIHSRAEDIGQSSLYRESFEVVTARAVARMSVLSEYCLPLCKVNGSFIALKGSNIKEELIESRKAIHMLGGECIKMESFFLPVENSERSIIIIDKVKSTPKRYPRKAGTPAKHPIS